jgi:hypothetical protein
MIYRIVIHGTPNDDLRPGLGNYFGDEMDKAGMKAPKALLKAKRGKEYLFAYWLTGNRAFLRRVPRKRRYLRGLARSRFWFTEKGWNEVSRICADEAKRQGYDIGVDQRKNPKVSDVAYKDAYQTALLPTKRRK